MLALVVTLAAMPPVWWLERAARRYQQRGGRR
jgi:hypothetical protein